MSAIALTRLAFLLLVALIVYLAIFGGRQPPARNRLRAPRLEWEMTATGLQRVAFFLLAALIVYVAIFAGQ